MAAQPQKQIAEAINSVDEAIRLEPELADVATLKHARTLLQRVHDKNAGEQGKRPGSYTQIVEQSLANLKQKG